MTWNREAEGRWWADRCAKDFKWFAKKAHGIDKNPKGGWLIPRVHDPLCDWFQQHCEEWLEWRRLGVNKRKHLMVCIFREGGKTTLLTNAGMEWLQVKDPELGVAIGSETVDKAKKWFAPIPEVLSGTDEFQQFSKYYGSWYDQSRMWSKDALVHAVVKGTAARDPSFATFGVRTGLSGWRPDVICFDDPISYEAIDDDEFWCDKVNEHASTHIPVLKRNGMRIYIVTPYTDDDLWTRQLEKHGARTVSGMQIPGIEPHKDGLWHVYYMPARDLQGRPTAPEIWSEERMREYERDNPKHYYAQVLCAPYNEKNAIIRRGDIDKLWVAPEDVPANLRISLHFDLALKDDTRKGKGDDNVITRLGHTRDGSGEIYHLGSWYSNEADWLTFKSKFQSTLQELRKANTYPFGMTDEITAADKEGIWENTLQGWCNEINLPMPKLHLLHRQARNKLARIVTAASYWKEGKFRLVRGSPGAEKLVSQMLTAGRRSTKDDLADACADGFNPVVYQPARREASAVEELPFDDQLKPVTSYSEARSRFFKNRSYEYYDTIE